MKRQYTNKRNPCPVCSNHHGCAIQEDGLIECLRSFSQQDAPVGYRFIKLLRNDMGGLFVFDDGNTHRIETLANGRYDRYSPNVQVKERLTVWERNRQFQLLLQTTVTTLSTQHVSHLLGKRQLSTQEINWLLELGWVRTWEPSIYAPVGVSAELPGISPLGKLLGMDGIAIAALNPDFHITGFQIATLLPDPKYIWLSSANHGGNGPQLPNGELPLFCWKHPDTKNVKVVILCEGALKSLLTAVFLWRAGQTDIAVIGTASAARYGEKTLKNYLQQLRPKEIRLMPDAGAILNSHIATANQETLQRCQGWGYQLAVGDWGHLESKEHLDIDELLAAGRQNEIKLMTTAAYFSRYHTHNQINQLLKQGSFRLSGDKLIELQPRIDSIENLDLIRYYATSIQQCRKGGYQVVVVYQGETITPSDFFALCPESIQKQLASDDREWGMLYNLKLWFRRMLERYRPKNGFGLKNPVPPAHKTLDEDVAPNTIEYKPGKLPRIRDCASPPKIIFKKGQRLQVYTEAIAAGWKHILDNSPTGTFKSYDAGIAQPVAFGMDQLWYFTSHARNVTTETVERNYDYLNVRNSGMVWDYTPNGKAYLRWPKTGELPDTTGNCHRSSIFAALRNKNISIDESKENPVCRTCHLLEACRSTSGSGFGYRMERRETLESDRIVAHPDSAPDTNDYDWSTCGNFWDEAMRTVQPIRSVAASLKDLDQVIAQLTIYHPEISLQLQPLWIELRSCLTGEIKQPHHGWNDAAVREMFGKPPDNLDEIIAFAKSILHPDLKSLFNTTWEYGVNLNTVHLRHLFVKAGRGSRGSRAAKGEINNSPPTLSSPASPAPLDESISYLNQKIQQDVLLNWFVPFLQVWGRRIKGALRINQGELLISTRNERHALIAQASGWNIYLDATATSEYLFWWMDVDAKDILTIEQEVSTSENLKIIQVTGLGQVSKQRSDFCQSRVDALRQEFLVRHPDIKFIDFVKFCNEGDGGWFRDSRGSNDFKDVTALATFGIPYQNIGSLEALYLTLSSGNFTSELACATFQRFVDWATQAEIKQAIGRLRSHNRPTQQVYFYFCADYDLSFLSNSVECVKAGNITIEAGSSDEKSWWKVKQSVKELWEAGQKITQSAVEAISGISQGYISKLASQRSGSWKEWLKIFLSLLNASCTDRNNSEDELCTLREEAHSIVGTVMELTQDDELNVWLQEIFSWQYPNGLPFTNGLLEKGIIWEAE